MTYKELQTLWKSSTAAREAIRRVDETIEMSLAIRYWRIYTPDEEDHFKLEVAIYGGEPMLSCQLGCHSSSLCVPAVAERIGHYVAAFEAWKASELSELPPSGDIIVEHTATTAVQRETTGENGNDKCTT